MQVEAKHPITELREALEALDNRFDCLRAAKANLDEEAEKFQGARARAMAAYPAALTAAHEDGKKIGDRFQRGESVISFDDTGDVSVTHFNVQTTYELRYLVEEKKG